MDPIPSNDPSRGSLRGLALLLALTAGVFFIYPLAIAHRIPLLDPDEGLHASIAQEMVERGDWVIPRLFGKPFLDKPILYFWAEAFSLRCFGMSELAVRLPGLMFGLLGAVTTVIVAWRLLGRRLGLIAGLLYATCVLPTALAQVPTHDVALVPWVNLAIVAFWESDRAATRRGALGLAVLAGLALGLAVLTKGLVGVALVGITVGGYLVLARRLRRVHLLCGGVALVIAGLIGSAWYLAVEAESPGYLRYFLLERHVLGFATTTQRHGNAPWWYYAPILLGGGLPWIAYLPILIQDLLAQRKAGGTATPSPAGTSPMSHPERPLLLAVCWLVGCTLFLTVSHSKLVTYIWPVMPSLAILTAVVWSRLLDGRLSDGARRSVTRTIVSSSLLAPLVVPGILLVIQRVFNVRFTGVEWAAAVAAGICTLAPLWVWITRRYQAMLAASVLAMAAQFVVIMTVVMPPVATAMTGRDLAAYLNRSGRLPSRTILAEERIGSVVFYLAPELRAGLREGCIVSMELPAVAGTKYGPGEIVVVPDRQVWAAQALQRAGQCFDVDAVAYLRTGRYRIYEADDVDRLRVAERAEGTLRR